LPIEALVAMTQGIAAVNLPAVNQPVLVVTSINDQVVDPASSDVIAAAVTGDVQRLRLRHSGHVATLDSERHLVQQAAVAFVVKATNVVSDSTGSRPTRGR
jgi:esterase/lipase